MPDDMCDVLVIGSGSAALSAALRAAKGGLRVTVIEKTQRLGGTSAMSGAGVWIPANHVAQAAGLHDSVEEALTYLRSASPHDWRDIEDPLWQAFCHNGAPMLAFLEQATPLRFELVDEPDPMSEQPGGKLQGRMMSCTALSRRLLGRFGSRLRRSTLPHIFTYREVVDGDLYHHPFRLGLKLLPKLVWRLMTDSRGQGSALMTGLLKGCIDAGCRIEIGTRALTLIAESDGRIIGAEVEQDGQRRSIRAGRGVVIATGGFEWDTDLMAGHFPGPLNYRGSPRSNTGDGQRMAAAVGAQMDRMDQANIYPCLPTRYEGEPHGLPMTFQAEPHSIIIDRTGQRFVSESDFNIGEAMDRRDPVTGVPLHLPVWLVADRRFLRRSLPFHWYARKAPGWVRKAATLGELARMIDVPADALEAAVRRFNGFCRKGWDLDFRRGESAWENYKSHGPEGKLGPIDRAPFVALSIDRSILGTKGGARTNDRGQVIRADGSVIAGLYAAGLAMANPIGTRALGAGTTLGPNLTWGYICAETLLRQNRDAAHRAD